MKCIYPNNVTLATADEEDANFPASYLEDDHPKKVWKGTSKEAELTFTVLSGSQAMAIFNTNADQIVATVKTATLATTLWGPATYDLEGIDTIYELITDSGENLDSLWVDYDYQSVDHKIVISASLSTGTIEMGVFVAGYTYEFPDPQYGLQEGIRDYSIVKELNNGAFYIRKRDLVKTFSGSLYATVGSDFYVFMRDVALDNGPNPLAWKVSTNYSNNDWMIFARFLTPPSGNHEFFSHSKINFVLQEVV